MFAKGFLTGIQFTLAMETTIAAALRRLVIQFNRESGCVMKPTHLMKAIHYKPTKEGNAMAQETCQQCAGSRLAKIIITSKDRNVLTVAGRTTEGYPPVGFGLGGGGDEMAFSWCLDCGQIQGEWPVYPEDED